MGEKTKLTPLRILVADDDPTAAELLRRLLEPLGHRVWAVHDGWSVIELAPRVRPDVFLLDINLPDLDGWQLTRWLREEGGFGHSLVVAITGYSATDDRRRSRDAGFDDHLTKPLDPSFLRAVIAQAAPGGTPAHDTHH